MTLPSLINIPNGDHVTGTFSALEMRRRLDALRGLMDRMRIDTALMTSYHNINYYGDFLYCSFGRSYGLVINGQGQTSISANIDGGQPARRTVGENLVYTDWQKDNYFKAVASLIAGKQRVGIEFDQVSLQMLDKLKAALPNCEFVDIGMGAMKLRMIKSPEEIEHISKMTKIADLGGAACVEAISVGVAEHEVALHSTQAMVREIARVFPEGELQDTWTWFQSGINTDGAHNPVTTRCIQRGDILSLNCFPMVAGYYVALERTLFSETASDEHLRLWEVNCKVHDEGKKLIRPGAVCSDIAKALNEIYAEHDLLQWAGSRA
jgi:creatinase